MQAKRRKVEHGNCDPNWDLYNEEDGKITTMSKRAIAKYDIMKAKDAREESRKRM